MEKAEHASQLLRRPIAGSRVLIFLNFQAQTYAGHMQADKEKLASKNFKTWLQGVDKRYNMYLGYKDLVKSSIG